MDLVNNLAKRENNFILKFGAFGSLNAELSSPASEYRGPTKALSEGELQQHDMLDSSRKCTSSFGRLKWHKEGTPFGQIRVQEDND